MGFIKELFKKPKPILNEEDMLKLREIQRKSYMEEAEKIMEHTGREKAKAELLPKKPKEIF